jgi:hypothetical protein
MARQTARVKRVHGVAFIYSLRRVDSARILPGFRQIETRREPQPMRMDGELKRGTASRLGDNVVDGSNGCGPRRLVNTYGAASSCWQRHDRNARSSGPRSGCVEGQPFFRLATCITPALR